ncbi:MAG: Glutamyl-tRNA(Gln) amidotransferase subunit A-like protein, partial [uncultured Rubellimicrobium sp.]
GRALPWPGARHGCRSGAPAARSGGGSPGQDGGRRAGLWRHLVRRRDPQPLEPGGRVERVQRGIGGGHRGGSLRLCGRDGNAGFHRVPLAALRDDGAAAHLCPGVAGGLHVALPEPRQDRAHHAGRRGRGSGPRGAERGRPDGPGLHRRAVRMGRRGAAGGLAPRLPARSLRGGRDRRGSRGLSRRAGDRRRGGRVRLARPAVRRAVQRALRRGRGQLRGPDARRQGRPPVLAGRRRLAQHLSQGVAPLRRGPRPARPAALCRHGGDGRPLPQRGCRDRHPRHRAHAGGEQLFRPSLPAPARGLSGSGHARGRPALGLGGSVGAAVHRAIRHLALGAALRGRDDPIPWARPGAASGHDRAQAARLL